MNVSPRPGTVLALAGAAAIAFALRLPTPDYGPVPESAAVAEEWYGPREVRILAKHVVAREAAAGTRSLVEAAALFRELDRLPPAAPDPSSVPPYRGWRSEEERLCRQVMAFARQVLHDDPPARDRAEARLAGQLQEELRNPGAIRRPDPAELEPLAELLERARAEQPGARHRTLLGRDRAGE
jgi:hypothetical protein